MSWWHARGMARISASNPRAVGECQQCGFTYNLDNLRFQMQYAGQKIINTQFRVCPTCYDEPTIGPNPYAIPADPVPVSDPTLENYALESVGGYIFQESASSDIANAILRENGSFMFRESY